MPDPLLSLLTTMVRDRHARGRSSAYAWLRANHRKVEALIARRGLTMQELATGLNQMGQHGRDGRPLSADAVRKVWRRVCSHVAEDRAHAACLRPPPRRRPSGLDPNRPPPLATTTPPSPAPSSPSPTGPNLGRSLGLPMPQRISSKPEPAPFKPGRTPEEVEAYRAADLERRDSWRTG